MKFSLRSVLAASVLASSLFAFAGCVAGDGSGDERVYDIYSNSLTAAEPELEAPARAVHVTDLAARTNAEHRVAQYEIRTAGGKTFKTTVTHRIQRDGADEVIRAEDVDTGEVVAWAFGAESADYTNAAGDTVSLSGDDETETFTVHTSEGPLPFDLAGIAEDSADEADVINTAALTIMGTAAFTEDQIEALSAALSASDEDLGASSMSAWGKIKRAAKKVGHALKTAYCSPFTTMICGAVLEGSIDCEVALLESGTAVAVPETNAICLAPMALAAGCVVGQVFACD